MKNQKPIKIFGVIGDPISHSLSPLMQNAALAQSKISGLYKAFRVKPENLKNFLTQSKKEKVSGLNITLPHKEAVLKLADTVSREAKFIGAANTLVLKNKKWEAHNTDARGYLMSLKKEANFEPKKKQIFIIGAGGAARAIAFAMGLGSAREVILVNRTVKRAHDLASDLKKRFPKTHFTAQALGNWEGLERADLLIQTTSIGVSTKQGLQIPLKQLHSSALVSDIVYTPLITPLLQKAKKLGHPIHSGWGMLLYQGALAFELWNKKKAPISVMREVLLDHLTK